MGYHTLINKEISIQLNNFLKSRKYIKFLRGNMRTLKFI